MNYLYNKSNNFFFVKGELKTFERNIASIENLLKMTITIGVSLRISNSICKTLNSPDLVYLGPKIESLL